MTLPEANAQRNKIKMLISKYAKKRFDASVLVSEYDRLTKHVEDLGGNPRPPQIIFTKDYWQNPCHKDREHFNRNPIIRFDNGVPVWKNWQPYPTTKRIKNVKNTSTKNQINISKPPTKTTQASLQNNYYILNIIGLDSFIDATAQFLTDLGLKPIEHSKNKVEWQFNGTDKEFNIVKRATVGLIDNLILDNHITVYGKKIYNKII